MTLTDAKAYIGSISNCQKGLLVYFSNNCPTQKLAQSGRPGFNSDSCNQRHDDVEECPVIEEKRELGFSRRYFTWLKNGKNLLCRQCTAILARRVEYYKSNFWTIFSKVFFKYFSSIYFSQVHTMKMHIK
jgi:hypothetical protein